jgi:hypothetical protein
MAAHKIVPGDIIAVRLPFQVKMDGANLVGKLTGNIAALTGDLWTHNYVTAKYAVFHGDSLAVPQTAVTAADFNILTAVTGADGEDKDKGNVVELKADTTSNLALVVFITFADTADQGLKGVMETVSLGDITLKLTQIRADGQFGDAATATPSPAAANEPGNEN